MMALEAAVAPRSTSPEHSGRASPIPRRWASQQGEDEQLSKDKTFRRYAAAVEKSLSPFETGLQEWADYISFLGRLLKSLQSHPSHISVIPSKKLVAKRLAQCMNPTLPSGVHQKALEVYNYVFSVIGTGGLSHDLPIYLPGLSSTLSFASLTVRTPFLDLLENYFLKVDASALRPALKALILSLLPGLEEETSEEFSRTLRLINGFKLAVNQEEEKDQRDQGHGDEYFWQCFFLASITSSSRRPGALAYLVKYLPKLATPPSQGPPPRIQERSGSGVPDSAGSIADSIVTSPEPGLLIRCFAAGLADEQILIQRGFLDLLVTHLPLHATVLQKRVKQEDLELLITAAIGVVARRDMSLNRRLWSWLLGPEPTLAAGESLSPSDEHNNPMDTSKTKYFELYGLKPLSRALLKMLRQQHTDPVQRAKPFRLCLSLMDRWEIGGLIVSDIFLPAIGSVQRYQDQARSKEDFMEVVRSASMFFDGVESGLIWAEIIGLIRASFATESADEARGKLTLVTFIITHFNVREEEMLLVHAPNAALAISTLLEEKARFHEHDTSKDPVSSHEINTIALNIAIELIGFTPERAFQEPTSSQSPTSKRIGEHQVLSNSQILDEIHSFYVQEQGNLDAATPPFPPRYLLSLLIRKAVILTSKSLIDKSMIAGCVPKTRFLINLATKATGAELPELENLVEAVQTALTNPGQLAFSTLGCTISLVTMLYTQRHISSETVSAIVEPTVRLAWSFLSSCSPKYHVEAVRSLWQLQSCLPPSNREIEAAICELIIENDVTGTFSHREPSACRSFGTLWTHTLQDTASHGERRSSVALITEPKNAVRYVGPHNFEVMLDRPLFLLLDALSDERAQLFVSVRMWLQNLVGIEKIFYLFAVKFSAFEFIQYRGVIPGDAINGHLNQEPPQGEPDFDQCLYYFSRLSSILRCATDAMWAVLSRRTITCDDSNPGLYIIAGRRGEVSLQEILVKVSLRTIATSLGEDTVANSRLNQLHRMALTVLHQILLNPYSEQLAELRLETFLIERLSLALTFADPFVQVALLEVLLSALKLQNLWESARPTSPNGSKKYPVQVDARNAKPLHSASIAVGASTSPSTPMALLKCIQAGISTASAGPVLDNWISFLSDCLPTYSDTIFQILLPLVETFCHQIGNTFDSLQSTFKHAGTAVEDVAAPESTLIALLNGLEQVLARGHERLLKDEAAASVGKSTEQPQGFFGNMVSGVFTSDVGQTRNATANDRLTVLLTFQDAVRVSFSIWSWGGRGVGGYSPDPESTASFSYTSLRVRNRARRLLEHLFAAETLECLETVVEIWRKATMSSDETKHDAVFNLLHVLDGSKPKHTIPAIFDAIYSRTNPNALEPSRKSTLTSTLLDTDLVSFLVEYARSLEDDAMDEIWTDCMTFLRDILLNPFPHRQTLPSLLEFAAILGEKADNTNFGEQRRMRKELGDLFLRLLTATFTAKPLGFADSATQITTEKPEQADQTGKSNSRSDDIVGILASITPKLPEILVEADRLVPAVNAISAGVIGPTFRSKSFPENVTKSVLTLLYSITRLPNTQKVWKKDLSDAFNDARFFSDSMTMLESNWLPLLRQWVTSDRERFVEILSRISPPTTAGIVFGVGATSARLESDRRSQLNLRRIATLILAAPSDTFIADLKNLEEKLMELFTATPTSSPSSVTRGEIYMVLRALVLRTNPVHLAMLWPAVNAELYAAISAAVAADHSQTADTYSNFSILQACKLLDTLLCIAPDDFQLHEWLFITDTIDAVHRPAGQRPVGLLDELSEELGSTSIASAVHLDQAPPTSGSTERSTHRLLLGSNGISCDDVNLDRRDELVGKVLRPFFSQLSIFIFERTYDLSRPDLDACRQDLLKDLFDEQGIVKAL